MLLVYRREGGGPINRNIQIRGAIIELAYVARQFDAIPSNNAHTFS